MSNTESRFTLPDRARAAKTRFWVGFGMMILLAVCVSPILGGDNWYIVLYHRGTKELVRVNVADGTQTTFDPGLDETTAIFSRDIAVAPDAQRIAYCISRFVQNSPYKEVTVYLRDLEAGANILELNLGEALECRVSSASFSDDGSLLAVGLVNYYGGDVGDATDKPIWQLVALDTATGNPAFELNADTPAATEAGMVTDMPMLPEVRAFANGSITFAEVPFGIGGNPSFPAYVWHLDDGTVEAAEHRGAMAQDRLDATGEVAWAELNRDLAFDDFSWPLTPYNAVMVADGSGEGRMVYHTPDWPLTALRFIDGGERLAMHLVEPINPDLNRWVALGRDGELTELGVYDFYSDLAAAPGGYVMLWAEYTQNGTQITTHLSYNDGREMRDLWGQTPPPKTGEMQWDIVWASPVPAAEGLEPFVAYGP